MKRPASITVVVVLQWVAAIVAVWAGMELIGAGVVLADAGAHQDLEAALTMAGIVDVSGRTVAAGVLIAGVLMFVVSFIRVLFSVFLWQGRAWARVAIGILTILSLLAGIVQLIDGLWLRGGITVVVDLVVLGLLFAKQSSTFIKSSPQ